MGTVEFLSVFVLDSMNYLKHCILVSNVLLVLGFFFEHLLICMNFLLRVSPFYCPNVDWEATLAIQMK